MGKMGFCGEKKIEGMGFCGENGILWEEKYGGNEILWKKWDFMEKKGGAEIGILKRKNGGNGILWIKNRGKRILGKN